ncbi:MAG: DNA mismatch repair endonuclease MutL [Bacteroidia bacterium]|nr:DNA mismatch repair endonuclease MutL [Bacteroidia bacterium]MDW8133550.1 DNA mismatch repair endonuclease MutL [Bacteroidia bacterium]
MTTDVLEQRIRILPESVINQIAAGEVVLRPASIIKELGENAIDAEAFSISFWTEEGGKSLIKVTDDGVGMSRIDAELCFERHATSKIQQVQDLYRLSTRGFRGEALASIAAVAEVELFTRRHHDTVGTRVLISFGEKRLIEPVRCAAGTTLIVRRLFHRLPVRRKALRSEATEHRHNLEEFFRLAYPHPERHFRFYHNKELLYDLPRAELSRRILSIHPELSLSSLVSISEETPFFTVQGYIVLPEHTPPHNREGYLFINRRYVRHGGIQQAIGQVYKSLLPMDTKPLYWLFLEVPPHQVDVNITPSKTEVRLLNEVEIRTMLLSIVRRALAVGHLNLPSQWLGASSGELPPVPSSFSSPVASEVQKKLPFHLPEEKEKVKERPGFILLYDRFLILWWRKEGWLLDLIGVQERILYERQLKELPVPQQGLLFPALLPLTPLQKAKLMEIQPNLQAQGLHIELREGREVVLHSIPVGLSPSIAISLLQAVLEMVSEESLPSDWRKRLAHHIAKQGAARTPPILNTETIEALWSQLEKCEDPNHSPDGRRIRFLLTEEVLTKLFS